MPFLTLSSVLVEGELLWSTYTAADILLVKSFDRKKSAFWNHDRIATPLTSKLKTSGSIESTTRSGKGRVGVGGDSDGDSNSNDGDDSSHNDEHSPQCSGQVHQWTHQLLVLVACRSKSRQKVEELLKKSQRSEKFVKAIGSEKRLPKHQSSVN